MNEITDQYEYEKFVRKQIADLYSKIFENLDRNENNAALEKIEELQNLLKNSEYIEEHTAIDQLPMQIKIIDTLKEYVHESLDKADLPLSEESEYEKIIEEISVITDRVLENNEDSTSKLAESELRTAIMSIPEVEKAFSVLSMIDEEKNDPEELILLGVISLIQFDRVIIESISGFDVKPGIEFYVFKRNYNNIELGSGLILDVSEGLITGSFKSSSNPSYLPEADDLVYIKIDANI